MKVMLERVKAIRLMATQWASVGLGLLGAALAFAASAASASAYNLPDGRAYELVTSAEGPLADVYAPFAITANTFGAGNGDTPTSLPFQVAVDGEVIAYVGDPTVGGIGDGGGLRGNEYLATRDGRQWLEADDDSAARQAGCLLRGVFAKPFCRDPSIGRLSDPELHRSPAKRRVKATRTSIQTICRKVDLPPAVHTDTNRAGKLIHGL